MDNQFLNYIQNQLTDLKANGLYKQEREIISPQSATITIKDGRQVLNFCSNNYLGLANHPELIQAALNYISRPNIFGHLPFLNKHLPGIFQD